MGYIGSGANVAGAERLFCYAGSRAEIFWPMISRSEIIC